MFRGPRKRETRAFGAGFGDWAVLLELMPGRRFASRARCRRNCYCDYWCGCGWRSGGSWVNPNPAERGWQALPSHPRRRRDQYLARVRIELEGFPTARRIPFGFASNPAVHDAMQDDAVDRQVRYRPHDIAGRAEANDLAATHRKNIECVRGGIEFFRDVKATELAGHADGRRKAGRIGQRDRMRMMQTADHQQLAHDPRVPPRHAAVFVLDFDRQRQSIVPKHSDAKRGVTPRRDDRQRRRFRPLRVRAIDEATR